MNGKKNILEEKEQNKTIIEPFMPNGRNGNLIERPNNKKRRLKIIIISIIGVLIVALIAAASFFTYKKYIAGSKFLKKPITDTKEEPVEPKSVSVKGFAVYKEVPFSAEANLAPYKTNADLSNIENKNLFTFSAAAKKMLTDNSFVVIPGSFQEFFSLYESNRYNNIANFVTTDSILHNYHLYFNYLLKNIETEKLIPEYKVLVKNLYNDAKSQAEKLSGTKWENAAKRNLAFLGVINEIMGEKMEASAEVQDIIKKEIALVEKHSGIELSLLMNLGAENTNLAGGYMEDYSQYIPRGHYTKSEDLKKYFKAMLYAGRINFRLKNEDETRSAILLTLLLSNSKENYASWEKIYEPTAFFVGKGDDLSFYEYGDVLKNVYGKADIEDIAKDDNRLAEFINKAGELKSPKINSMPIFDGTIKPDREKEIKGWRLMGQRFTMDASILERLVYREVKENSEGKKRMLPKGLDIPAAMGSKEAYNILDRGGETDYANYKENMRKLREYLGGVDLKTWTQNLYWAWLYTLKPLTDEVPSGYPTFMKSAAWPYKEINTYLGNWTELKHDTILYAKQVYAELGGSPIPEADDRGYVEPNPKLYARLASLLKMTKEGLKERALIEPRDQENLDKLVELVMKLKTISEKELQGKELSKEEFELIRAYGGSLEHFWLETLRDEKEKDKGALLNGNPAAIVTDVATDPNGAVLEEGTGRINTIYVVAPVSGKLKIAAGGVYSYYEFTKPLSERLTDEAWREILEGRENVPALPSWTKNFITED